MQEVWSLTVYHVEHREYESVAVYYGSDPHKSGARAIEYWRRLYPRLIIYFEKLTPERARKLGFR